MKSTFIRNGFFQNSNRNNRCEIGNIDEEYNVRDLNLDFDIDIIPMAKKKYRIPIYLPDIKIPEIYLYHMFESYKKGFDSFGNLYSEDLDKIFDDILYAEGLAVGYYEKCKKSKSFISKLIDFSMISLVVFSLSILVFLFPSTFINCIFISIFFASIKAFYTLIDHIDRIDEKRKLDLIPSMNLVTRVIESKGILSLIYYQH